MAERTWTIKFEMRDHLRWRFREAAARRKLRQAEALVEAAEEWVDRADTPAEQRVTTADGADTNDEGVGRG